ncbi:MAG TPA: sugar phosphate nucleotidyltransferase [Steroidobacteraceae bacterium]|nr:sugar phosphate nucleotidyltransferase [Steroidobacteraceae bacterium]
MQAYERWDTHWDAGHNWALVLAAGDGSRLQALTMTASGVAIPKQFCSLGGDVSLLHDALRRARVVADAERTCAIVAEYHRRWWQPLQLGIPAGNLISQPRNRGTATGILLPLLHIVHRDPEATLLVLPSDHYVRNEEVLAGSLRSAMTALERDRSHVILLGITPDEPDPELGYIVADGSSEDTVRPVREFVEKPTSAAARALIARGGVWNSFIFAANGQALLRAFEARCPDLVGEMRHIVTSMKSGMRRARLAQLYEQLPGLDFSRDILQRSPELLRVMTVPACGWTDLGTPQRVVATASRFRSDPGAAGRTRAASFLDLAVASEARV